MRIKAGPRQKRPATVWLVFYDREHVTEIRRGENEGVKLTNSNVVRKLLRVARMISTSSAVTTGSRGTTAPHPALRQRR